MDFKVYKKEQVLQPNNKSEWVYMPNIIDLQPIMKGDEIVGCNILEATQDCLEQEATFASIFQQGLDPIEPSLGVRWSEALLEEISVLQLVDDIVQSVNAVSSNIGVSFETVKGADGNEYLSYKIVTKV